MWLVISRGFVCLFNVIIFSVNDSGGLTWRHVYNLIIIIRHILPKFQIVALTNIKNNKTTKHEQPGSAVFYVTRHVTRHVTAGFFLFVCFFRCLKVRFRFVHLDFSGLSSCRIKLWRWVTRCVFRVWWCLMTRTCASLAKLTVRLKLSSPSVKTLI